MHAPIRRLIQRLTAGTLCLLMWMGLYGVVTAQPAYPPRADLAINDFAGVIGASEQAELRQVRAGMLASRGAELVVATIGSVNDYDVPEKTLEAFATQLFNSWGVGDRARNDGVLLLVAVNDRKVRIELGRGYGSGYNSAMQQVIEQHILPSFRAGNYGAGILAGAQAIQATLAAPASSSAAGLPGLWLPNKAALGAGALLAVAGGAYAIWRATRRQRERCPTCGKKMRALQMPKAETYLSEGQQVEIRVDSMRYVVWLCPRCGHDKAVGTSIGYRLTRCPSCNYQTLASSSQMLPPSGAGKRRKQPQRRTERSCHNCRYTDHRTETIAATSSAAFSSQSDSYSSSSDTGSSTSYDYSSGSAADASSSSSYDAGGSSAGDGASGSW